MASSPINGRAESSPEPELTIENICTACGKGCETPCELWYDLLEGKTVTLEDLA